MWPEPADVDVLGPYVTRGPVPQALTAAVERIRGAEEAWLVTDYAHLAGQRRPQVLLCTSSRLVVINSEYRPVVEVPAGELVIAFINLSEARFSRNREGLGRSERNLTVRFEDATPATVADRLRGFVEGRRPVSTAALDGLPLRSCIYIGGHGLPLEAGTPVTVVLSRERTILLDRSGTRLFEFPTEQLTAVEIGGPGAWQKGGRIVGGGFGALGAAEGMLIAAALNKLTARSGVTTVVELRAGAEMTAYFQHDIATPAQLSVELSWLLAAVRARPQTAAAPPAAGVDLAAQLRELAQLHAEGVLDADEFAAAKRRILQG